MVFDVGIVFPAYAGVIPIGAAVLVAGVRVPRVCGGDPYRIIEAVKNVSCSPRKRG